MQILNKLRSILLGSIVALSAGAQEAEAPPPSIAVAPNRIVLEVGAKPATESATIVNLGNRSVNIDTSLVNWDLDDGNEFRELPPDAGSLPAAIILNPVRFTIPEGGSQTVRFMVLPERLATAGEHRAMMFFSEIVDTDRPGIKMRFRLGMPIYARLGEADLSLKVHDVNLQRDAQQAALEFDISALGNAHVRPTGYYLLWPKDRFPGKKKALKSLRRLAKDNSRSTPKNASGGPLSPRPVMPGTRRKVSSPLQLPAESGNFVIAVHLSGEAGSFEEVLNVEI